ncbi:extracellular solute-binding protein [Candidatus Galacturonibacter soehngenii]|uniref:Extracellular solute-binding protein n=1 Tax=Candidatus Galacturonatibacter soehngenii TaxID=2307010 RepID=A0A7V7QLY4_9FIRM|nr:extracellular solute-binding protein [Candidatus Galacturonibacter soehngenii]KAB1439600.1 extracellular solute-binding protein [Candidatus Galacturonibacter soehngenii]
MKEAVKKILITIGVILIIGVIYFIKIKTTVNDNYADKYDQIDFAMGENGSNREGTYCAYLNNHANAQNPKKNIDIDLYNYDYGKNVEVFQNYEGEMKVLYTGDESKVTWSVDVVEAGFYNVYLEYMTVESRGVAVERSLLINGENPFKDAANLVFNRLWTDDGEVRTDNQGNEIRPTQIEAYEWQSAYCKDGRGYEIEPYRFYFEKGKNSITLEAVNEPVILRKLALTAVSERNDYKVYSKNLPQVTNTISDFELKIQGEDSTLRSESSLYAKYDRASPTTEPNSVTKTVLNYIGGETWNSSGQWIEWEFQVPEDGYYNITVKGRQNYARGSISCRSLYIDGEVPFKEVEAISFHYGNDWNVMTLADEDGTPYKFYLTKGRHLVRLEATLGNMGEILEELEDSTYNLNQIYRKILVYTGADPDDYRDYNLEQVYPEVIKAMDIESKRLYKIIDDVVSYTGQKAEKIATAQTLAQQLEQFVERPDKITVHFIPFKDNITALGTAILNMSETKLDIDYLIISSDGFEIPNDKASKFAKVWHEIKSFVATFFVDYDAVGDVYSDEDPSVVKVWIVTGRDQGTILKTMVDDTFTPEHKVKVNVEIVEASALLNAVVAGRGPDVVLSVGADQPVNYALRNAVEDLTQFKDYSDVLDVFYESAYRPYEYNNGIYAIPETQTYNVLFYRKDILEELALEIPNTWKQLIEMLPTIQGNNMEVGIPTTASATLPDASLYYTLLYQNGSDIYDEEAKRTIIDNEAGVNAFTMYTSFFTEYGMPREYDFVSRFRSGQMPIGIANYSIYNTLMVSAPEIRGLWDFTLIPGTVITKDNGQESIKRSVYSTGTCSMMIKTEDEIKKQNAWKFMKWWAQTDVQVRFGRELEALLGSSARYATANKEAFSQLAWSAGERAILNEQWKSTVGFREVAGGYYTNRHIINAVRKVMNKNEDPRETVLDYAITINEEIIKKRTEFGLSID